MRIDGHHGKLLTSPGDRKAARSLPRQNPATQITGPSLFLNDCIAVGHELDLVHVEIHGQRYSLHYTDALQLAHLTRTHAKHAKRLAGDSSKHWAVYATLTDGEEDDKRGNGRPLGS